MQTCQPLEIQTCILKPTNLYFSIKTCIFLKHAQTGFLYLIFRHENRLKKKKAEMKSKCSERSSCPYGRGSRGPLKARAPGGVQGHAPVGVEGAKPPEALGYLAP